METISDPYRVKKLSRSYENSVAEGVRLCPPSGGSKGGVRDAPPGPKFHFHAVFGKNWPNNRLAPPPLGNPGSATATHPDPRTGYATGRYAS